MIIEIRAAGRRNGREVIGGGSGRDLRSEGAAEGDGVVTDHVLNKRWRLSEYLNGEWD